jgi:hypothetical protein
MASSILFGGLFAFLAILVMHEIARVPHTAVIRSIQLRLALFIIGLACSIAGGFVSAKIAGHDELLNGALSSILCVTLGIFQFASGHADYQPFVQVLMMIASPTFALLGGYFRLRQKSATLRIG